MFLKDKSCIVKLVFDKKGENMKNNQKKVYSYGIITPSELMLLEWNYPKPDEYAEVKEILPMTGGEACNSSIVLSQLGVQVQLDGLWFGNNAKALKALELIQSFGVDTSNISIKDHYQNVEEFVIADKETRTIFASYGKLFKGNRLWNIPNEDDIQSSNMVCLDPFLQDESKHVAELCVRHNVPYVTVDCKYDDYISKHATVNIISGEFRGGNYPNIDKKKLINEYAKNSNGITIFTSADDDILYMENNQLYSLKPYQIQPIDTAGAGDSFRSGIIYGLLHGYDLKRTIAFASLLASYICVTFPGVTKCPTMDELIEFSIQNKFDYHIQYPN